MDGWMDVWKDAWLDEWAEYLEKVNKQVCCNLEYTHSEDIFCNFAYLSSFIADYSLLSNYNYSAESRIIFSFISLRIIS
jgi:hypothetical protein